MIYRVVKDENFVVMHKGFLNNKNMSWQAKGLLAYMLSLPNDWEFCEADLVKRSTNGRDATRSAIKELVQAGHIIKQQTRRTDGKPGRFGPVAFDVLEIPNTIPAEPDPEPEEDEIPPSPGKPSTGNPTTGNPTTENPTQLNNKRALNNKRSLSNKKEYVGQSADAAPAPQKSEADPIFKDVISYLNSIAGTEYRASGKKTQQLIKARQAEGFGADDFKRVIELKAAEWLPDQRMSAYIRPETLFGPKFEGYLNEWRLKRAKSAGSHTEQSNFTKDLGF